MAFLFSEVKLVKLVDITDAKIVVIEDVQLSSYTTALEFGISGQLPSPFILGRIIKLAHRKDCRSVLMRIDVY
jgi:hypothetical protein